MSHLLAIAIGPVQGFIAAARKTRDLWYGSDLLSEVSRAAARSLREGGAALIFPHPAALDEAAEKTAVANKILAVVDGDPARAFDAARAAAQAHLDGLHRAVAGRLAASDARAVREAVALPLLEDQVAEFLEVYGAWVPYELSGAGAYATARAAVDHLLDGRKGLRDFAQPRSPWATRDGRPKSTLDAGRESVLNPLANGDAPVVARRLRLKPGEQLDGVSLLKRLESDERFVSVSRVALDPFIRRLASAAPAALNALQEKAQRMHDARHPSVEYFRPRGRQEPFAPFPFDTQLFYHDGRYDEDLRDRQGAEADPDVAAATAFHEQVREACRRIREANPDLTIGVESLPAYYAILHADGDRMGRLIGRLGELGGEASHRRLSGLLADFARGAATIVARHGGALVYSGGDDVLAFLPLDTALRCADALRRQFRDDLAPIAREASAGAGPPLAVSLSVGVAIVHYREPLDEALGWARRAEKAAKGPRDALAVALHTHGGGPGATVVRPWGEDPVATAWERWVGWHQADAVPDGLPYELRELARHWRRALREVRDDTALLWGEVRRIALRKYAERGRVPLRGAPASAALPAGRGVSPAVAFILGRLAGVDEAAMQRALDTRDAAREIPGWLAATTAPALLKTLDILVDEAIIARRLAEAAALAPATLGTAAQDGAKVVGVSNG